MINNRHINRMLIHILRRILTADGCGPDISAEPVLIGNIVNKLFIGDSGTDTETKEIIRAVFGRFRVIKNACPQRDNKLVLGHKKIFAADSYLGGVAYIRITLGFSGYGIHFTAIGSMQDIIAPSGLIDVKIHGELVAQAERQTEAV